MWVDQGCSSRDVKKKEDSSRVKRVQGWVPQDKTSLFKVEVTVEESLRSGEKGSLYSPGSIRLDKR